MAARFFPLKKVVFISSKGEELQPEREAIQKTISTDKRLQPDFYEGWGSGPKTPKETLFEHIRKSNIYVGIFWNRYSKPTEDEYREAKRLGKPCLIYIKDIEVEKRDKELAELLKDIGDYEYGHYYTIFKTISQLRTCVKQDIDRLMTYTVEGVCQKLMVLANDHALSKDFLEAMSLLETRLGELKGDLQGIHEKLDRYVQLHELLLAILREVTLGYEEIARAKKKGGWLDIHGFKLAWELVINESLKRLALRKVDTGKIDGWLDRQKVINNLIDEATDDRLPDKKFKELKTSLWELRKDIIAYLGDIIQNIKNAATSVSRVL